MIGYYWTYTHKLAPTLQDEATNWSNGDILWRKRSVAVVALTKLFHMLKLRFGALCW